MFLLYLSKITAVDGFVTSVVPRPKIISIHSTDHPEGLTADLANSEFAYMKEHRRPLVGIIGGMGPAATLRLQELVLERDRRRVLLEQQLFGATNDSSGFLADSLYTPFLLYNNPQIPNNNRAALGLGPSSVDALTKSAIALRDAGADVVAFACTTAYTWQDQVSQAAKIPVLNLLQSVAERVRHHGHQRVGLLDVDGTHACGAFRHALERCGLEVVLPQAKEQASIMESVANIKSGIDPRNGPLLAIEAVCHELAERDQVTAIILGCTEIATAFGASFLREDLKQIEFFDALEILADNILMPLSEIEHFKTQQRRDIQEPQTDFRSLDPQQPELVVAN